MYRMSTTTADLVHRSGRRVVASVSGLSVLVLVLVATLVPASL